MRAMKTEVNLIWPCVAFLIASGAARALDMHWYKTRKSVLTADEAARWEMRYQISAMIYAVALGTWCSVVLLTIDDAVPPMISLSLTPGYLPAVPARTYGRP